MDLPAVRRIRCGLLGPRGQGGHVTQPPADAALDALADALAPRIFERLKRLAAEEAERDADDSDTLEYLERLGWKARRAL